MSRLKPLVIDCFLDEIFVSNAIGAALGHNKVYESSCGNDGRRICREKLANQLRSEAKHYVEKISDAQHCEIIRLMSATISKECGNFLVNKRLRIGTIQKAFNLYLKFLWRLEKIPPPLHCPIDSIVLDEAKIAGSFTKCDSIIEYSGWIEKLKLQAKPCDLAEWESKIWLKKRKR